MPDDDSALVTPPGELAVCCLACGVRYQKPVADRVTRASPGCPACGYLGWVLDAEVPSPAVLPVDERPQPT